MRRKLLEVLGWVLVLALLAAYLMTDMTAIDRLIGG